MKSDLIERYIAEIGKHLPLKERKDIQQEIRSTLEDMLEDRSAKSGKAAEEQVVVDLLKEFGKPEDVAASYQPDHYLVGPALYPIFSLIVKIVLPILASVLIITMSLGLFSTEMTFPETLVAGGKMALEIFSTMISAFGGIALTFGILEWIFSTRKTKKDLKAEFDLKADEEKVWDPRSLPQVRELEKFSLPGLIVEISLTLVAAVVLNFFPDIIGIYNQVDGEWVRFPLLSKAFFDYMPYLNGLWGLQVVLNLFLISRGRWEPLTRWLHITMLVLGIGLLKIMLFGPDLIVPVGEALATVPEFSYEAANFLAWMPRLMVKVGLGIGIITNLVDLVRNLLVVIADRKKD